MLKQWESEKLSLVIIEGTGEKAFCAGGDIRAITSDPERGSVKQAEFFAEEYKLNNLVSAYCQSLYRQPFWLTCFPLPQIILCELALEFFCAIMVQVSSLVEMMAKCCLKYGLPLHLYFFNFLGEKA